MRLGELVALRINDVDWDAGTIRVDEALTDVDGHLAFEDPKTARGFRAVPMADLALDRLRSHIEQRVGWADPRALLFTAPNGATLRPNNWRRRHFDPAVSKVGLSPLTPHDLRVPQRASSSPRVPIRGCWPKSSGTATRG